MKIFINGTSSFTGYWFAKELTNKGHEVYCALTKPDISEYSGVRYLRLKDLQHSVNYVHTDVIGSPRYLSELDKIKNIDLYCNHAHDNTDYRSPDYHIHAAVKQSLNNLDDILQILKNNRCKCFIHTGTVFEENEGVGDLPLISFSPYATSKSITFNAIHEKCTEVGLNLGKFVIPNPFGAFEDDRMTTYIIHSWLKGEIPEIKTPLYIRDNIHADLLALDYVTFCEKAVNAEEFIKHCPSQYASSQKDFAELIAKEMAPRLNISCKLDFFNQTQFDQPKKRVNSDHPYNLDTWNSTKSFDLMAQYYLERWKNEWAPNSNP